MQKLSAIEIANFISRIKKIGSKVVYQQNYWSNRAKASEIENLNPTASLHGEGTSG